MILFHSYSTFPHIFPSARSTSLSPRPSSLQQRLASPSLPFASRRKHGGRDKRPQVVLMRFWLFSGFELHWFVSPRSHRTQFLSCLLKQNYSGRKYIHRVTDQACTALLYARECARIFLGRESGDGGYVDGRHRGLVMKRRRRRGRGRRLGGREGEA